MHVSSKDIDLSMQIIPFMVNHHSPPPSSPPPRRYQQPRFPHAYWVFSVSSTYSSSHPSAWWVPAISPASECTWFPPCYLSSCGCLLWVFPSHNDTPSDPQPLRTRSNCCRWSLSKQRWSLALVWSWLISGWIFVWGWCSCGWICGDGVWRIGGG